MLRLNRHNRFPRKGRWGCNLASRQVLRPMPFFQPRICPRRKNISVNMALRGQRLSRDHRFLKNCQAGCNLASLGMLGSIFCSSGKCALDRGVQSKAIAEDSCAVKGRSFLGAGSTTCIARPSRRADFGQTLPSSPD